MWFGVMTRRFILFDPAFEVVHPHSYVTFSTFEANMTMYTRIGGSIDSSLDQRCLLVDMLTSIDPTHTNVSVSMNVTMDRECGYVLYSSVRHFNEVRLFVSMLSVIVVLIVCVCFMAKNHLKHQPIESASSFDDDFKVQDLDKMSDDEGDEKKKAANLSSVVEAEEDEEAKFDREMSQVLA